MTGRHRARAPRRRAGLDLGTLPRRAAAQAGPLTLVAVLVALVVALVAAVPRAVARVSDAAVQAAVARAGTDADLVVTTATAFTETGQGYDGSAELSREAADQIATGLAPRLGDVLRDPLVSTASAPLSLAVAADDPAAPPGEVTLRLVWTPAEGAVTWVSGTEPAAPPERPAPGADGGAGDGAAEDAAADVGATEPAPVQVALSEAVARAVGATTGDPLHLTASDGGPVEAVVAGVFRPVDPAAATWHDAPDLLDPRVSTIGPATSTAAAALLSDDSLAAAVAAVGPREVQRTVRVALDPARVGVAAGDRVLAELPALQASPGTIGWGASGGSLHSSALGVLRAAAADLAAARAAATSLVVGGVVVGALLLVLTAGLLARRRAGELATRRTRGAALPALAVELGAEAVVVVGVGAVAGVLAAGAVVPGAVPVGVVLAVAGVAALALPVGALRVAHGAADPGRRRRAGGRADARALRLAAELALVALAAGAVVALRSSAAGGGAGPVRGAGTGSAGGGASPDLLAAAAPALLAAVGAVAVARALPALVARLAPLAERSRHAVGVLAVARARSDGLAPLPLLAVVTAAALVVVGASAGQAVRDGQDATAWASVGGDARVQGAPGPALASAAAAWAREPGVSASVAARVARDVPARSADGSARVDVVVGEPDDLARLAASLPAGAAGAGAVTGEVVLRWEGEDRTVHALPGLALPRPSAGRDAARAVVAVDVAELGGVDATPPGTVWLVGPGAEAALRAAPPPGDAEVATRTAALRALRADVLPRALLGAAGASVALLLAFVALAVLVSATEGAPARRRALDTLRTVGLTDREARRVAAGEVLPAAVLASVAGAALGCGVAPLVLGPLGLGTAPAAGSAGSVAWVAAALPVLAGLVAGTAVLRVEHARRRTHRLGEVLRAGG
ncbi:FtsX-like permease family protein [Cellulomonas sp. Y8]|uniref:FtsX-like permease family protein n=1 Tax=Cellulomonas sp. Y8 TaxID=2591145 RepID=UPI0011C9B16E|nr:FtsX-like permease family protein [Cellulomonas sp. Y8]